MWLPRHSLPCHNLHVLHGLVHMYGPLAGVLNCCAGHVCMACCMCLLGAWHDLLPRAAAAGNLAVLAEQAVERARANEQDALSKMRAADAARQALSSQVEGLERGRAAAQLQAGELQQQLERLQTQLHDLQVGGARLACLRCAAAGWAAGAMLLR